MVGQRVDDGEVVHISEGDMIKLLASRAARALGLDTPAFWTLWAQGELDQRIAESNDPDVVRWEILMSVDREHAS